MVVLHRKLTVTLFRFGKAFIKIGVVKRKLFDQAVKIKSVLNFPQKSFAKTLGFQMDLVSLK